MLPQQQKQATPKPIKVINIMKGVVFLLLAVLFIFVRFYNISAEVNGLPYQEFYVRQYFNEFFKNTYLNYIISALFVVIGILELKEGANNGN